MKTGRLLKFRGPSGEVQAHLYREAGRYCATVYPSAPPDGPPSFTLTGAAKVEVERAVRAWVAEHHRRAR